MKKTFLILFTLFSIGCCAQDDQKFLEKAFKENSISSLDLFLQKWQSVVQPLASFDSLSRVQQDVYTIFEDFYNPFNLGRIGPGEFGADLYKGLENVVVQNKIFIYIYRSDDIKNSIFDHSDSLVLLKDSIVDFRPKVTFGKARILYLTPKYSKTLNNFLGNKYYPLGTGGIMNPARAKGSSAEKLNFLNSRMKIIYGHWGGYYHIETHPQVFSIYFNKGRTVAKVNYRLVYQGGEANYKKINGKWVFTDAHLTWIE